MDKLRKAIRPVLQMAQLTAMTPVRYGQTTFYESKPFNIFQFLYSPVIITLLIVGAICKYVLFDNKLKQNLILPFFHEHALIFYSIFVLIVAQCKFNETNQTAMLFNETEIKLRILRCDLQYKWLNKVARWIVLVFLIIAVCIQVPITYSLIFLKEVFNEDDEPEENKSLSYLLFKFLLMFIARIIGSALRCYFIGFMMVLRSRFSIVNKEINKIAKFTETESKANVKSSHNKEVSLKKRTNRNVNKVSNLKMLALISHTGEEVQADTEEIKTNGILSVNTSEIVTANQYNIHQANKLKMRNSDSSKSNYDPFENKHYLKIRLLADIHDKLCLNLATVNSIFSVQLLFMIGIEFVLITASLYNEYIRVDRGFKDHKQIISFSLDLLGNILRCSQLLFIIWICSNTCSQANQASFYIHKIVYMEESKLKREIENFSMQLLHNKVQISAGGFFPVDFTLLYTIVGAITTYLVILVQFYLAAKAAGGKKETLRNKAIQPKED